MDANIAPGFDLERSEDADVITVTGEVDLASSPELDAMIERTLSDKCLVVDLSRCTYIDSSALSVFVRTYKSRGSQLRIVIPPESRIRRLFELTKLDVVLSIVPNRDAALR